MEEMLTLGQTIKKLREEECMTQRELASLIGKSVTIVNRWEADEVVPSLHSLKALAFALRCDARNLIQIIRER